MKNILTILFILIGISPILGQMPTNGDYTNWDWEDISQDNWKKKNGNIWEEINSPFNPSSERLGTIVEVYETTDYTKEKGWELAWAQFDGEYPYFIIYNPHKSIIRSFFYLESVAFEHALATLSYHSEYNNPGILSFGTEYQNASDIYLSESSGTHNEDLISVIIPDVSPGTWCSADFPIIFDKNIQNSKYTSKKWVFQFYGCENYSIILKGTSTTASSEQHTISGKTSSVSSQKFDAQHTKLHKQLKDTEKFMGEVMGSVKGIDSTSPKLLQKYKSFVEDLKPVSQVFSAATGISSAVKTVLGFFRTITGNFGENESTTPATVIQNIELEGTMDIKFDLGGNTLKIPGVQGNYFPPVQWNAYDCTMGIISLEKTPYIRKTTAYEKYRFYDEDITLGTQGDNIYIYNLNNYYPLILTANHPANIGYFGKFVKYKFEDDNIVSINKIPGLSLDDIRFALVCKMTGEESEKIKIAQKDYTCKFVDVNGREYYIPVLNPIYRALDEGRLKVYKYDEENNEVYIGTPELSINELKNIVIEVPEKSEIMLRVIAKFNSDYYENPIFFQANYNMDIREEAANISRLVGTQEQTNFDWSDYYTGDIMIELNSENESKYEAGQIILENGFKGINGFRAKAINVYPSHGNTQMNYYNLNCNTSQKSAFITKPIEENKVTTNLQKEDLQSKDYKEGINVYPNPVSNIFSVRSNSPEVSVSSITILNSLGVIIYSRKNIDKNKYTIGTEDFSSGYYIIKTKLSDNKIHTNSLIINK
ncbi:MAG: T9SS type A sorting domain-containing protein [bacterium]|nr:T9SS type A sorting domain-containing protein [bacterium]